MSNTTPAPGTYLTSRIKEALYNANGNKTKAIHQITSWAAQDQQLLQALTRAHLGGIIAYHVDRVASGKPAKGSASSAKKASAKSSTPRASKGGKKRVNVRDGSAFGQAILKAASDTNASVFGLESYAAPSKDDLTSQRHVDAVKHLASFSHPSQNKRSS